MSSWVRYSVAVYIGLLMAGAFGTIGSFWSRELEGSSVEPAPRSAQIIHTHAANCPKTAPLQQANLHPCRCGFDDVDER